MKISEFEAYERRKTKASLQTGVIIFMLVVFAYGTMRVANYDPPMKYGSFNNGIEDRIISVLESRSDLGSLLGLELKDPWADGYRVSAKTTTYDQLIIYFTKGWEIKTIRNAQMDQLYP